MKKLLLLLLVGFSGSFLWAQTYISDVWVADQGNGIYINPILHADYSDPDVCVAGDDFYMTASSFNCVPGLPILHSKDLINWRLINHAVKKLEPVDFYNYPQHGKGIWAPSIRYHEGEFYIYWGDPDFGIYMVKTQDPAGEWEQPVLVKAGKGMIDPAPLWDEDGKAYLTYAWAGSRSHINSVLVISEMSPDGTTLLSDPVLVFDGNEEGHHTVEGPKLYKRNGYYYILAPAGGVQEGWQLALRSENIYGPYESRVVMQQGNTAINGPHQGGWVETQTGESWFIHFQDKGAYGRVVHLNPMLWVNDWPVIGEDKTGSGCGEPVRSYKIPEVGNRYPVETPVEDDEFNVHILGVQWQWHANYQPGCGFPGSLGYMRIYSHILSPNFTNFWEVPNLLLQKFMAETFVATTKVRFTAKEDGQKAGLIIMGWDYSYIGLKKEGDQFILEQGICYDAEEEGPENCIELTRFDADTMYDAGVYPNYCKELYLRVEVVPGAVCSFLYSMDGREYIPVGKSFKARQGKWIGAKVGYYAVSPSPTVNKGWLDIDWFRVTNKRVDTKKALDYCISQINRTLKELSPIDYTRMPRNILTDETAWNMRKATKEEWTAGFWPGILWYGYEYSGDPAIRKEAEKFTESLQFLSEIPAYDHDLGFLIFCSYGNGYRLTNNPLYKQVILQTADTLATLFNPVVGTILSWPREVEPNNWPHNTIMDNLINLEMLFRAAEEGGNSTLYDMAVRHADRTMEGNFRPDHTSYHVAVYDTISGDFIKGVTHQGYADDTMWARGQAWGIYGYTFIYRETGDPKYLDFAQKITDVYLENLPSDMIPYWDFNAPGIPDAPRDASSAAIVASALLELSTFIEGEKGTYYFNAAENMLHSLSSPTYQSGDSKPSFLLHSTGHWPNRSEIDAAIIYADYYYIEALLRLQRLYNGENVI